MKKIYLFLMVLMIFGSSKAQQKNNFEDWKNKPAIVTPAENNQPPSDAIVLFGGNNLDNWQYANREKPRWNVSVNEFSVTINEPDIFTRQSFGSCQLHVEWKIPDDETHDNLNWGNSGIYFMGLYEVQIYDSYQDKHEIYYNGQAGSIYKQHSPLVNTSKPAEEWQSFDIIFTAPAFNEDKSLKSPAYFTVFQNGIIIQNHVQLTGPTVHTDFTEYQFHETKLPLMIQSHGSKVSYRNIWIRELN
jgi:hypothetical protein